MLHEEAPGDANGRQQVGSVVWKTETIRPEDGQAPEVAVRADVDIPDRGLRSTMLMRRNADKAVPASHVIDLKFDLPSGTPADKITSAPELLM